MKVTDEQVDEIISYLQGTTNTLDGAVGIITGNDELDSMDLTPQQLEHIDNEIFLCETCGWWCEVCEMNGDQTCDDCTEEDDDDDE